MLMRNAPVTSANTHISRRAAIFFVCLLLVVHLILALSSIRQKSATFDEIIHVTAGYHYWTAGDYRFQPENGNLPQRWAALPLVGMGVAFPEKTENVWTAGHSFFYKSGNDADAMLFAGRSMIALLSVMLAATVYFWAAGIFGRLGGLISLALYSFSPTMLAHGRLTTSDMAAALFFMLSVRAIAWVLHRVDLFSLGAASLAVAGLMLSKMSGVLIVPVSVLLILARLLWGRELTIFLGIRRVVDTRSGQLAVLGVSALVVAMVSFVVIWGAYGFRFSAAPTLPSGQSLSFATWERELDGTGHLQPLIRFARDERLIPEAYLYGFSYVLAQARTRPAFLNGDYSMEGWWYFFPFCMAVKTPLVTLLLVVLGMAALIRFGRRDLWEALSPLIFFAVVYGITALTANINIGHRHVLPIYPVLFILSGAAALWFNLARRFSTILAPLLLVVYLAETLLIWPHYLAFFNVTAGGPKNGYRLLVDSSLDWGQDLPGVSRWIDTHRTAAAESQPVYLAYFGSASPIYYRIPARIIVNRRMPWTPDVVSQAGALGPGTYLISATELQQVYGIHGRWNDVYDRTYWFAKDVIDTDIQAQNDAAARERLLARWKSWDMVEWIRWQFVNLRFARLCHHLKRRPPDGAIGYSILVYEVSPEELNTALWAPLEEIGAPGGR